MTLADAPHALRRAERLAADGWTDAALEAAAAIPATDPTHRLACAFRAGWLVDADRVPEARALAEQVVAGGRDDEAGARARIALARMWRRAGGDDAAMLEELGRGALPAELGATVHLQLAARWDRLGEPGRSGPHLDRAVALAGTVPEPERRGWLLARAAELGRGLWPPERIADLHAGADAAFDAAALPFGRAMVARATGHGVSAEEITRVLVARGRRIDRFRDAAFRAVRAHEAGELAHAAAAYATAEGLAGERRADTWVPARLVLAVQQDDDVLARGLLAEVNRGPVLRPMFRRAVAFSAAVLGAPEDAEAALRSAWSVDEVPTVPAALAAAAAVRRLGGTVSPGARSRTRAVAIAGWSGRDPAGRARLVAEQRERLQAGDPVPCGGFDLVHRLGAGGMGEVWRATYALADDIGDWAVKLVRADRVADDRTRRAFDREIRAVAALSHPHVVPIVDLGTTPPEDLTGGQLAPGAPWFAMPLAQGSAAAHRGRLEWTALRRLLAATLSALAHVHANDLLHLDVKPENLLCSDPADPGAVWLADFGQAWVSDDDVAPGGTPAFMAPEQYRGRAGRLGPWTDLYAVGGVAWDLACGGPPFGTPGLPRLRQAHLHEEPPPMRPVVGVPVGFEAWARTLLEKDPAHRFASAAAAAAALAALGEPAAAAIATASDAGSATTVGFELDGITEEAPVPAPPSLAAGGPLPVPETWRALDVRPPGFAPSPALLHHRRPLFVGRQRERDTLWETLKRVVSSGEPDLVVLVGPSGIGARRLAEWLARSAAELGVARHWDAADRPPAEVPVVWRLEGLEDLPFDALDAVLGAHVPVLTVVPLSLEEERDRPAAAARLAVLDPRRVVLGPLAEDDLGALLRSLVPLRVSTRRRLADAAAGSPGRAVDLVRDAADTRALRSTGRGWTLSPGWSPPPPGARYTQLRERLPPAERASLEVAAALGASFSLAEWTRACAAAGLPDPLPGALSLADRGLLVLAAERAAFAHPDLRAALDGAEARERWHRACVAALEATVPRPGRRIGRHLLEAGEPRAALVELLDSFRSTQHPLAESPDRASVDAAFRAAGAVGVVEGDPIWERLVFHRAAVIDLEQDYATLREHVDDVMRAHDRLGLPVRPGFLVLAARAHRATRSVETALALFARAAAEAATAHAELAARAHLERARLLAELGRWAEAADGYRSARDAGSADGSRRAALIAALAIVELGDLGAALPRLEALHDAPEPNVRSLANGALGDLYRYAGRFDEAGARYAAALAEAADADQRAFHRMNLALLELARRDTAAVVAMLPSCRGSRAHNMSASVRPLLGMLALLGPSEAPWAARLEALTPLFEAAPIVDRELSWVATHVADALPPDAPPWVAAQLRAAATRWERSRIGPPTVG